MTWGTIRQATATDEAKLAAVMERFNARHDVNPEDVLFVQDDGTLGEGSDLRCTSDFRAYHPAHALKLRGYLKRNIRRAIGGDGIAYGYVGYHAN